MTPLFTWSGQFVGFISRKNLFTPKSKYLGWIEDDGSVWWANGKYAGEIVDENYILRHSMKMEPMPKMPHMTPMSPMAPMAPMNRMAKLPKLGYVDALE
jgi:hypothetical protein